MKRFGLLILIIAVAGGRTAYAQLGPEPAASAASNAADTPAGDAAQTTVSVLVGRSTLVSVPDSITRVSLTSADVADALVTSPTQLLVHGKVPGAISMFVWNREGTVQRYEVLVQRDLVRLQQQMRELMPNERVDVRGQGKFVVLSGTATSKDAADRAVNLAVGFVERREEVVSVIQIAQAGPTDQVLLRVRFAEVSRATMTEFGMSLFTSPTGINNTIGRVTTGQFAAPGFTGLEWTKANGDFGSDVTSAKGQFTFSDFMNIFLLNQRFDLGLMIRAMQQRGLFESLAEPNLVAESGKEASFLAGGEFPVPVAQGSGANLAISVVFKEFGIRLNFTPTVNGDRIRLKVKPEVSTLDFANAVVMQGFRIPALATRRTETELELQDGQTFAIAGLMNNTMNSTLQKIPGIGDIPILGQLFRSRAAQKNQTELVVMITPTILRAGSPGVTTELPRLIEPFIQEIPQSQTLPAPPPAFTGSR